MSPSFKSVATTGSENYVLHCVKLKSEYISAIWSVLNALVLFACSSAVRVTRSIVLYACFVDLCLSFVIFLLPLCCLSFFDLRILITPLVSLNSSQCQGRISPMGYLPCDGVYNLNFKSWE